MEVLGLVSDSVCNILHTLKVTKSRTSFGRLTYKHRYVRSPQVHEGFSLNVVRKMVQNKTAKWGNETF